MSPERTPSTRMSLDLCNPLMGELSSSHSTEQQMESRLLGGEARLTVGRPALGP